jgi:hypothetical protein
MMFIVLCADSVFKDPTKYSNAGWQKMIADELLLNRFQQLQGESASTVLN